MRRGWGDYPRLDSMIEVVGNKHIGITDKT